MTVAKIKLNPTTALFELHYKDKVITKASTLEAVMKKASKYFKGQNK